MSTRKKAAEKATEAKGVWPVIHTVRKLQVPLSDDDIRNLGRENAHIGAEIEALTAAKKASTQNYAAQITERSTKRGVNDAAISNGWFEREVQCVWRYELNRRLENDPARKVLVRLDTGVVVDEAFITDDERQLVMRLAEPEASPNEVAEQSEELPLPDFMAAEKKKGKSKAKKKTELTPEEAAEGIKESELATDKKDSEAEAAANS